MNGIHSRFDFNLLRVLAAVAEHGSVTGAAASLSLTQSAVSHALARLRAVIGDPLFVRQGKRVVPTAAARALLPRVQAHLRALSEAVRGIGPFDPATADCAFKLGFRDVMESIAFPPLLSHTRAAAPGVRFESRRVSRESFERELASGALDAVVDLAAPTGRQVRSQKVLDEPLAVVVRRGHAFARRRPKLEHYVAARHVLVTLKPEGPEVVDLALAERDLARDIVLRCQHYYAACRVVAATDLLLTMPETYARVLARDLSLHVLPLPFALPRLEVRLYWHASQDEDAASRWLRRVVLEAFAGHR
jgi:DNA-binding transcriptional LysR family regulator